MPLSESTSPTKPTAPDADACWTLVERIASSKALKRAIRLRDLLLYVGRRSLKEHRDKIHESEIGAAVFGRPAEYDTSADPIVRVNATELRKRIEAYFGSEGLHETLVMEIPRGSYIPVFRHRLVEPLIAADLPAERPLPISKSPEAIPADRKTFDRRYSMTAAIIAVVFAAGCAVFFWSQNRSLRRSLLAWKYKPSVAASWTQILNANPETDIVTSDASIGLVQTLAHRTFPLKDYLSRNYVSQLQAEKLSQDTNAALNRILAWNLGSPDEFMLARRILALDPLGKNIRLYNARYYMADLMRRDNVILIGARKSNPWDELFESRTNFLTEFNDNGVVTVMNRAPLSGEQKIYTQTDAAEYCVVAYLPNSDLNGIVLLIEGTDAEATEAAGDFLLSEDQLSNFKRTLHVNQLPYFEVLLKVSSVRGTPLTATIDAYRTYPNLHLH
jgi:hypothetical protein